MLGTHKLEYVLEFVNQSITQQQLGEPPDAETLATVLLQNWDEVTRLFSDRRLVSQLQDFSKERTATLLSRIFRTL
jgi:biotin-(acetyl-CoA carboxylase) ligase